MRTSIVIIPVDRAMMIATLGLTSIRCTTTPYCAGMHYKASAVPTRALCCTAGRSRPRHVREAWKPGPAALCRQLVLQQLGAPALAASGMTHIMVPCGVPAHGHEAAGTRVSQDPLSIPVGPDPKLAHARRSRVTRAVRVASRRRTGRCHEEDGDGVCVGSESCGPESRLRAPTSGRRSADTVTRASSGTVGSFRPRRAVVWTFRWR